MALSAGNIYTEKLSETNSVREEYITNRQKTGDIQNTVFED